MRLDSFLVENGYYASRTKAKEAIEAGLVLVNGKKASKASTDIPEDSRIEIAGMIHPYVSRGGLKLEGAVQSFRLDLKDKVIVDIGASTGGFTDCCLQFGAKRVYAVDVGTNQLSEKLLADDRVISLEQTNIMDIPYFPEKIDYFVMDVSFVSITHLLPAISGFITEENALVCLIKPQFEVGKVYLKNGIVRDRTTHIRVLETVDKHLKEYGLCIEKLIPSPILGGSGNKEFLALIKRGTATKINLIEVCSQGVE